MTFCLPDRPGRKSLVRSAFRRLYPEKYSFRLLSIFALALCFHQPRCFASPAEATTLTVAGLGYQAAQRLSHEGLDEFTRKAGIRVDFVPAWGTSTDQLTLIRQTLSQHFSTPDVYLIDVIWPGTLHRELLDLTPYLDEDARAHLPELLRNDTTDGRVVALPFYMNAGLLYYRTDLLRKYGFSRPPRTWKELEKMAARIQSGERRAGHSGFWGYVWQGAAYEGLTCNALEWQASFGGGRIIEPDGTISVNNPRTAQALSEAAGWAGSISPPSVLSYREADSLNVFRSGNAAFMRYWSSGYHSNSTADSAVRGRFNVALLPAGPYGRAQTIGGFELAVSRYSAHPRKAAELVVYLTGSKAQKARAIQEGYLPTIPRLYSDREVLAAVPEVKVVSESSRDSWVSRPSIAAEMYSTVSKYYYTAVHRVLSRQCGPEKALNDLEKELADLKVRADSRRR